MGMEGCFYTYVLLLVLDDECQWRKYIFLWCTSTGAARFRAAIQQNNHGLFCQAIGLNHERLQDMHDEEDTALTCSLQSKLDENMKSFIRPNSLKTTDLYIRVTNKFCVSILLDSFLSITNIIFKNM